MRDGNKSKGVGFRRSVAEDYVRDAGDLEARIRTPGDAAGSAAAAARGGPTMETEARLMAERARQGLHTRTGARLQSQKGRTNPSVVVVLETASGERVYGQSGNFSVVRTDIDSPQVSKKTGEMSYSLMDKRLEKTGRQPPFKHAATTKVALDPRLNPDLPPEAATRVTHGRCAEQDALDQAAVLGKDVRNGRILAVDVGSGEPVKACESCRPTLTMHGVEDLAPDGDGMRAPAGEALRDRLKANGIDIDKYLP